MFNGRPSCSTTKSTQSTDFPVDDGCGVARVRKVSAWENLVMLAEGFGSVRRSIDTFAAAVCENDHWLALAYPEDLEIASDSSYTRVLRPNATGPQCACS
jgi:hypothetical protein